MKTGKRTLFYFAYGSNMNHSQIRERCPNSKFIRRAYLGKHRLQFDGVSKLRNDYSVANVVESEKDIVWGGLFEISEKDLSALDMFEGYPKSYNRKELLVIDDNGKQYDAIVYFRKGMEIGSPSPLYIDIVLKGAKDCRLPKEYIEKYLKTDLS